jgi:hypothetical protein
MIDLPWWPPFEPMGDGYAGELIQAIKPHAPRDGASRTMIARMKLEPHMRGIPIGNVSIPGSSGKPIIVGISVTRAVGMAIVVPTADGGQEWIGME